MTDAEVLCEFMEVRRIEGRWWTVGKSVVEFGPEVWHRNSPGPLRPTITTDAMVPRGLLALNECHEVEARLTDEQWGVYCAGLRKALYHPLWGMKYPGGMDRPMLHATAEQKIRALATVLRKEEPRP